MKQIKGILLFLMSIVLVAFGSQNSKSSKNLVKRLEDETKKVGNKIKENELEAQSKKEETTKQPIQQKQPVVVTTTQPQPQSAQPQQPTAALNEDTSKQQTLAMSTENNNFNGKTGNKKNRKNNKNGNLSLNAKNELYKAPKHSRLKNKSSFAANDRPIKVKSQDSVSKSSSSSSSTGGGSSSGGASSSDSSSSE